MAYLILVRPMKRLALFYASFSLLFLPCVTPAKEYVAFAPRPTYPDEARAGHLTGSGIFALYIRRGGGINHIDTIQSIGHRILDDAATSAFRQWRFHPKKSAWVLRIPIRYVDGPPRHDAAMSRPPQPGYGDLITVFSRHE